MGIERARSGSIDKIQKQLQKPISKLKGKLNGRSISLGSRIKSMRKTSSQRSKAGASQSFRKLSDSEIQEKIHQLQAQNRPPSADKTNTASKEVFPEAVADKGAERIPSKAEETKVKYEALGEERIPSKAEETKVKYEALGEERIGSEEDIDADKLAADKGAEKTPEKTETKYSALRPEVPAQSTKPKVKPRPLETRQASQKDLRAETEGKYDSLPIDEE